MSSIMQISNLLKEEDSKNRIYLIRNGQGAYTIMTVAESDELDRIRAARSLETDPKRAEDRAGHEGWIDADDFDREMGIIG